MYSLLKMGIFHCYVSLPEGRGSYKVGAVPIFFRLFTMMVAHVTPLTTGSGAHVQLSNLDYGKRHKLKKGEVGMKIPIF